MPGYSNNTSAELGGILATFTKRNLGNSEQLLYTATKKSAVVGFHLTNVTTGTLPVSAYIDRYVEEPTNTASLTSNVVTITFTSAHSFAVGDSIGVALGVGSPFNGSYTVASVPSSTSITYAKTGDNIASTSVSGGNVNGHVRFYIAKDRRVTAGESVELVERPFHIVSTESIYAYSGVQTAFDVVLSIQEGVN